MIFIQVHSITNDFEVKQKGLSWLNNLKSIAFGKGQAKRDAVGQPLPKYTKRTLDRKERQA